MFNKFIFKAIDYLFNDSQNPKTFFDNNIKIRQDIKYNNHIDCLFDFYYKDTNIKPLIINIHGGGFVAGDKKYRKALAHYYISNNDVNVINVNYPMSDKVLLHESIQYLVSFINFLINNKNDYYIDLNRIMITGDSSGAYFALALTMLSNNKELQDKLNVNLNINFKCVFLNCGCYSFKAFLYSPFKIISKQTLLQTTGSYEYDKYKYFELLEPYKYINSSFPNTLVCDSLGDFICGTQSKLVINEFNKHNIKYQEFYSNRKSDGHVFLLSWKSKGSIELQPIINSFIKENLIK